MTKAVVDFGFGYEGGFGLSQAVRARDLVLLSGQMPMDPDLTLVGEGDIRAQTRKVLENMRAVPGAAGLGFDDVAELVGYHTDLADLGAVAEVKTEVFPKDFPAWAALGVTALAFPGQLIGVKATAIPR